MASREVRRLVYARLALWGSIQRDGPLAPPRSETGGGAFGSRLPVPTWCTDLTMAFAALNPQTRGMAARGDTAWLVHAPFNLPQAAIWAFYVEGLGLDGTLDTRSADATHWEHQRQHELQHATKRRDWKGDELVARKLHLSPRTAHRYRADAVWAMADLVRWEDEVAASLDIGSAVA